MSSTKKTTSKPRSRRSSDLSDGGDPPTSEEKGEAKGEEKEDDLLIVAARELVADADRMLHARGSLRERDNARDRFCETLERFRKLVPAPFLPNAPKSLKMPLTQMDWDSRVLTWALAATTNVTLDRALAALAPETPIGSEDHNAIAASLNRLPRDLFTISWYLANTSLSPMWVKK